MAARRLDKTSLGLGVHHRIHELLIIEARVSCENRCDVGPAVTPIIKTPNLRTQAALHGSRAERFFLATPASDNCLQAIAVMFDMNRCSPSY